ncbi:hypothetical protein FQN57_002404 [Myotisia sp. PD_48]|nr:hypothetical protein FQN57_002404 [Myotisia sp. PD_48]
MKAATIILSLFPFLALAAPEPPGQIQLTADYPNDPEIDGLRINAAGRAFWVGGKTASYCPIQVGDACPPGDETVIGGLQSMYVMVPGGQQIYVEPSGALGFTQAHSAYIPPGSYVGGMTFKYLDNHNDCGIYSFEGWGAKGLMACYNRDRGLHQVYANIANATVPDCKPITALGCRWNGSGYGAWQYT